MLQWMTYMHTWKRQKFFCTRCLFLLNVNTMAGDILRSHQNRETDGSVCTMCNRQSVTRSLLPHDVAVRCYLNAPSRCPH